MANLTNFAGFDRLASQNCPVRDIKSRNRDKTRLEWKDMFDRRCLVYNINVLKIKLTKMAMLNHGSLYQLTQSDLTQWIP